MKKFALFIVLAFMAVAGAEEDSAAQYVVKTESTRIVVANPDGEDVINIHNREDDMLGIRVAGVEVLLGHGGHGDICRGYEGRDDHDKSRERVRVRHGSRIYQALLEVGVNMLPSPDYSLYSGMELDVPHDFMILNNMKSLQWAISVVDGNLALNRQHTLSLSMGMQLVFDDYTFGEKLTLVKENGILVPQMIDSSYKKSKINTFSIKVPLMFHICSGRSFHFSAGVYGGVLLGAHTKIKFPKEKMYDPYMNPFYYGVTARLGFRSLYIYANCGLSDMFKKGHGPVVAPVTIGLGLFGGR